MLSSSVCEILYSHNASLSTQEYKFVSIKRHRNWNKCLRVGVKITILLALSSAFGVKTLNINPKSKEKYPLLHQLQNLISQSLSSLWFTYFPYIGSELFSYKYVINQAFLWTEMKSWSKQIAKKKRTRLISSHLDRKSMVNKGFIILQKHFALNQEWLFISLILLLISLRGWGGERSWASWDPLELRPSPLYMLTLKFLFHFLGQRLTVKKSREEK